MVVFCETPCMKEDDFEPLVPFCYSITGGAPRRNEALFRVTLLKSGESRALSYDCMTFLGLDGGWK